MRFEYKIHIDYQQNMRTYMFIYTGVMDKNVEKKFSTFSLHPSLHGLSIYLSMHYEHLCRDVEKNNEKTFCYTRQALPISF